ncbi:MAG: hypothetical protein FWC97_03735 [Treponema sp.]|nr:hypothetical protein [Treponema sp.]
MAIILSNCARTNTQQLDFSLHNTVSIFLLKNETGFFFCMPIQYLGDFHISCFEFIDGLIVIGDYKIPLLNDNVNIFVYLNQKSDENGSSDSGFDLVFEKKRGNVLISKMIEPLSEQQVESDGKYVHYYIFIERFLEDHEVKKIKSNYAKGNVYSRFEVWFNLIIDGEPQIKSGVGDDFELYTGHPSSAVFLFPNLNFFRAQYL